MRSLFGVLGVVALVGVATFTGAPPANAEPGPSRVNATTIWLEEGTNRCVHNIILTRTTSTVTARTTLSCAQPQWMNIDVTLQVAPQGIEGSSRACPQTTFCSLSYSRSNPAGTQRFYATSPNVGLNRGWMIPGTATPMVTTWG